MGLFQLILQVRTASATQSRYVTWRVLTQDVLYADTAVTMGKCQADLVGKSKETGSIWTKRDE